MTSVSVEKEIAAPADALYAMVSDVTRMGEWSPETTSCRWLRGSAGAAVGARFKGSNKDGWRRWSSVCTVVEAEPGRRFAFDVTVGPLAIARWSYDFSPGVEGSTTVTESWEDHRSGWVAKVSAPMMGVPDREDHNRMGMVATLEALARAVA